MTSIAGSTVTIQVSSQPVPRRLPGSESKASSNYVTGHLLRSRASRCAFRESYKLKVGSFGK
jgi:hypothetical protein